MRAVRTCRTGMAAAVIAWKLAALALLPAALCCRAVLIADETGVPVCCEGGEHGAACPMSGRAGRADGTDAAPDTPRLVGCPSLDDALVAMLGLSGFTPDRFELASDPLSADAVAEHRYTAVSLTDSPAPPPPRV